MHKRDVASKGRETADKESVPFLGFHMFSHHFVQIAYFSIAIVWTDEQI